MQRESLLLGHYLQLVGNLVQDIVDYHRLFANELAAILHTGNKRHIAQQSAQALVVGIAALNKFLTLLLAEVDARQQSLQADLNRCHGSFQLVVYIVCQLSLDAYLLLLLSHCSLVCNISVLDGLLPLGV